MITTDPSDTPGAPASDSAAPETAAAPAKKARKPRTAKARNGADPAPVQLAEKPAAKNSKPPKRAKKEPTATESGKPATKKAARKVARPAGKEAAAAATERSKVRQKLVRDSFTMPREDFDLIATLKQRALEFKRPAKKSELLRAGLQVLQALSDAALQKALDRLALVKTGRPKKV